MSDLITNLQTIYNTKLAIKEAIGTASDNFVDYPSYISGMVTPIGTYNISDNGNYDISSYAFAYVNVSGGGGVVYTWIDWTTSPVLTQGDKVSFNGYLGSGDQITQEIVNVYPDFADYLGWYMYPVGGWDHTTTGTTPWEKYVLSENQLSISQNSGVVVYGEIIDIVMGSATQKMTILEDINETKYAGGNGTKDITSNGTQLVNGYKSVNVNVQSSGTVLSNPTISYTESTSGLNCEFQHSDGDYTVVQCIDPDWAATSPNISSGFNITGWNTPYTIDVYNIAMSGMNQAGYSQFIVTRNEPDWSQGTCFFCETNADPSISINRTYLTNFSYNFGTSTNNNQIKRKFYLEYNNVYYCINYDGNTSHTININNTSSESFNILGIADPETLNIKNNTGQEVYNLTITFDVVNKTFTVTWDEYEL